MRGSFGTSYVDQIEEDKDQSYSIEQSIEINSPKDKSPSPK